MIHRNSFAVALLLACAFPAMAVAQTKAKPAAATTAAPVQPSPVMLPVDDPRNKLHLTSDQQTRMYAILKQGRAQAMAIQTDKKLSPAVKQSKIQALGQQVSDQEKAVMTPEQRKTAEEHVAAQDKYRKAMQDLAAKRNALQKQLMATVTADQKKKADAARADVQAYGMKLQNDKTLNDSQKRAKYSDKIQATSKQLMNLYTPSQRAMVDKLDSMNREMQGLEKLYYDEGI